MQDERLKATIYNHVFILRLTTKNQHTYTDTNRRFSHMISDLDSLLLLSDPFPRSAPVGGKADYFGAERWLLPIPRICSLLRGDREGHSGLHPHFGRMLQTLFQRRFEQRLGAASCPGVLAANEWFGGRLHQAVLQFEQAFVARGFFPGKQWRSS